MSVLIKELDLLSKCVDFSKYKGKRFLITGSTGFIGSMITRLLLMNNISVVLPVRDVKKAQLLFGDKPEYIESSIENLSSVDGALDYVIHAASPTKSSFYINNPVETIQTAVLGTNRVLEIAWEKKIKSMVYLSSMEIYGVVDESANPITEDKLGFLSIEDVRSSYSESKRLCELMVKSFYKEYGVPAKIIRLANCFGPGVPNTDGRMFMQFAKAVVNKESIVLHTQGLSNSNFVYISDAICAIFIVLEDGLPGESYNACNDKETRQVKDIANMVASKIAKSEIEVIYDIPEENTYGYAANTSLRLNSGKLRGLGWEAKVSMETAYRRLIEYLKDNS